MDKPDGNHPPKADCRFCKGTGKRHIPKREVFDAYDFPCICTFVDHKYSDELGMALGRTAKKVLSEMREEDASKQRNNS